MSRKSNKPKKSNEKTSVLKTIGIVLLWIIKIPYYVFIWFCYLVVFANLAVLIGGLITGDFGGNDEFTKTVTSIIAFSIILFILSFITRKVVLNTFEFFMFGNNFGVPTGIALMTALILVVFASLLQLVHIEINTPLLIVLVIVSLLISIPIFKRFAKWYRKRKELRLQKEEEKKGKAKSSKKRNKVGSTINK